MSDDSDRRRLIRARLERLLDPPRRRATADDRAPLAPPRVGAVERAPADAPRADREDGSTRAPASPGAGAPADRTDRARALTAPGAGAAAVGRLLARRLTALRGSSRGPEPGPAAGAADGGDGGAGSAPPAGTGAGPAPKAGVGSGEGGSHGRGSSRERPAGASARRNADEPPATSRPPGDGADAAASRAPETIGAERSRPGEEATGGERRALGGGGEGRSAAGGGVRGRLAALRRSRGLDTESGSAATVPDRGGGTALEVRLGARPRATTVGTCHVVRETFAADRCHGDRRVGAVLERPMDGAALLAGDRGLAAFDVRRALFLDIETTGLDIGVGTLAFLVGTAHFRADTLVLEQWILGAPDDEPALLEDLADRVAAADYLVTYNGRTFDVPLLRTRYLVNRQGDPAEGVAGHLDLLPGTRRLLRHALPDCRLATVEARVLGVRRVDDVAGARIPACYHAFLHDDDVEPLRGVARHNRDDVLSMVTLLDELLHRIAAPEATLLRDPPSALAIAAQALHLGALDEAARIYELAEAIPETREMARRGLSRVERRRRRRR